MSRLPLRVTIYRKIYEMIQFGEFEEGSKIPSEPELCRLLKVSRTVIREALLTLEEDGIIETKRGKGRYVINPSTKRSVKLSPARPLEMIFETDLSGIAFSLQSESVQGTDLYVSEILGVDPGTPIAVTIHKILSEGFPIAVSETYVRNKFIELPKKNALGKNHTLHFLKSLDITRSTKKITPALPSKQHANLLEVDKNKAVLLIHQTIYQGESVIAYLKTYINTDRISIELRSDFMGGVSVGASAVSY